MSATRKGEQCETESKPTPPISTTGPRKPKWICSTGSYRNHRWHSVLSKRPNSLSNSQFDGYFDVRRDVRAACPRSVGGQRIRSDFRPAFSVPDIMITRIEGIARVEPDASPIRQDRPGGDLRASLETPDNHAASPSLCAEQKIVDVRHQEEDALEPGVVPGIRGVVDPPERDEPVEETEQDTEDNAPDQGTATLREAGMRRQTRPG